MLYVCFLDCIFLFGKSRFDEITYTVAAYY